VALFRPTFRALVAAAAIAALGGPAGARAEGAPGATPGATPGAASSTAQPPSPGVPGGGAGGDEDPFAPGAFDEAAGLAPGSAPKPRTEYLLGGSALISANAYVPAAMDGYAAASTASGKVFGKVAAPDYGSLYISYAISQPFLSSLSGSGSPYAAPAADLSEATYSMPELYYSFDAGKAVFVRLGKQLVAWGPSRVWSPVDFVNSSRADFFAPLDLREGKSGLKVLLPFGGADAVLFADLSAVSSTRGPRDLSESAALDGRIDAPVGGFELGLAGRAGREVQGAGGLDFSGDFLGSAVYGELALAPGYGSYEALAQASLGFSRALGDLRRWILSAEGFYNSRGRDLTDDVDAMASAPLYSGAWYAYAAAEARDLVPGKAAATASALANISDGSYMAKLAWDFDLPGAPPFTASVAYYGGGGAKELTYFPGDKSIALGLQTRIDF